MYLLALVLRGLWWRRGLTAAVLIVATITTASAALGPLYARAAAESTLHDQLSAAPVAAGIHYAATGDVSSTLTLPSVLQQAPQPGSIIGYPDRIVGIVLPTHATGPGGTVDTTALWRQGICQHVVITSGHCPTQAGQVLVSQRTVAAGVYGWRVGGTLSLSGLAVQTLTAKGFPIAVPGKGRIVGSYRPIDTADPYWFGHDYFDARVSSTGNDTVDTLIVAQSEFTALASPANAEVDVDLPLDVGAVQWSSVPALRRGIDDLEARYSAGSDDPVQTSVESVLAAAQHQRSLVNTGTTLVTLQLGLLAWLVLFQVVADAAEARGNEIALAKLRGRGPLRTLRFGLSEPLLLLLAAVPFGLLLALLAAHIFAATVLSTGTPVVLPLNAVLAAVVAFAGGCLAAVVTGQRTLTRSALDQWRRTTVRPARSVLMLLFDLVVAGTAIAVFVVLRGQQHSGTSDSAALLAPGLLVLAVALLGVRLLPPLCRALVPATRARRRIGLFLAVRQVGRRPAGLRLAALLAIAVGLATFAVAGEAVARGNRSARASAEIGAAQVAVIQYETGHDPIDAVQAVDPDGHWAMAAASWLPAGGDSVAGTVLGVDGSRLAAVASPVRGGLSAATLAATVGAAPAPAITITATSVRLHVTAAHLSAGLTPDVQVNLRTPTMPFLNAEGGALRDGPNSYVVPVPCATGCSFRGITWDRPVTATDKQSGTATLTGIDVGTGSAWTPLDVRLGQPAAWRAARPAGQATDAVRAVEGGVQDDFSNENGGYGGLTYASSASPMPAVATARALVAGVGTPQVRQVQDNSQNTASFVVRRTATVLPAALGNGVVMDVRFLDAELPDFAAEANWQVWLGPHAPSDAVARLRAAGLVVQSVRSEHSRINALGRQGPALALLLLLGCAIAGTVLAVGGTAISVSASSRRRSFELAALRAVGISRRALLRAGLFEQLLVLGTAVILGVPSGLVAAWLALPAVPEFADASPVALHYTPPPVPIVVFVAGFVVLLSGTALISAQSLIRVAVPARLREAEE